MSWRGRFSAALLLLLAGAVFVPGIYPFLATTERVEAPVLAVEGWVHDYAIGAAVNEFTAGSYHLIVTTGGPVQGIGGYKNDYSTVASIGAGRLRAAGLPDETVWMAPSRVIDRDRTYSAALALKKWMHAQGMSVAKINVLTEDVHARRTRLLFEKAFGNEVAVGIIAVPNPDYDASRWWRYSAGVRDVLGECISYLYARFLFFPPRIASDSKIHGGS